MTTPPPIPTCGTCLHHSARDACCELTGETRKADDAACMEHSDGAVEDRDLAELRDKLNREAGDE